METTESQAPTEERRFRSLPPVALATIALTAALLAGGTTYTLVASHKDETPPQVQVSTSAQPAAITTETSTVEAVTPTTVTTVTPSNAIPTTAVATSSLNRIVTIDTTTGKTVNVLKSWPAPGDGQVCNGPGEVTLSPDRRTVYFVVSVPGANYNCGSEIHAMTIDGAELGTITSNGTSPAISPDGTQMFFARVELTPSGSFTMKLLLMDLSTKHERVVKTFDENVYTGVHATWSPNGKTVVYQASVCGCGDFPWLDLVSLDVQTGTTHTIHTQGSRTNSYLASANYLPDGSLAALEQGNSDIGDQKPNKSGRIVIIDTTNGSIKRTLTTLNTGASYSSMAVDAAGKNFTFVSDNALMKYAEGGKPAGYAYGVWSVAW